MRTKYSFINMAVGIGGQLLTMLLSFIGRMFFIRYLSAEYLGVNGLFTNVLSVLGLAELGIGSAMIYSMYKPAAENDEAELSRLMNLYRILYRYVAFVVVILSVVLFPFLGYLVKGDANIDNLGLIYFMYVADSVASYLLSYKNSILLAYQKAYFKIGVGHILHIVQIILQITVLAVWNNFILYLSLQMIRQLAVNVIVSGKVDKEYPYLKKCKEFPDKAACRNIGKNVLAMSMHRLGTVIVHGTDNLIMSAFVGLKSVGIYSNYQMIYSSINVMMSKIYGGFSTSIGNLGATENPERIYRVHQTLDFFVFLLYGYISVGLFEMINPFIELVFGKEYLFSSGIVTIMAINFYITGMRQINLQFRTSLGLFWNDRYKPVAEAVINLVVSIVLVKKYQVAGIFLGTIVSSLTTCFWIEPYILMRYGIKTEWKKKLGKYFITYAVRCVSVIFACAVSHGICRQIAGKGVGWFIARGCICTAVYIVMILFFYSRSKEFSEVKKRGIAFSLSFVQKKEKL